MRQSLEKSRIPYLSHGQSDSELEGADHHVQNRGATFVDEFTGLPGHLVSGLALAK
jgi:hypothetical protein